MQAGLGAGSRSNQERLVRSMARRSVSRDGTGRDKVREHSAEEVALVETGCGGGRSGGRGRGRGRV